MITAVNRAKKLLRSRDDLIRDPEAFRQEAERLMREESRYQLNRTARRERIIVSLTSYPARFGHLHLVIRSMLLQTLPPDEIILWPDEDALPDGRPPASLAELCGRGLQIRPRGGELRPHKKYYYAMLEHPDALILTIDDDILYPPDLIERLVQAHRRFPGCVIAARAHRIEFRADGTAKPYRDWDYLCSAAGRPSLSLLATGCGGVLYPPGCMHADLLNQERITALSPGADDLWLKVMQVLQGTRTVLCDNEVRKRRIEIPGSQADSLVSVNLGQNRNDEYFRRLTDFYGLSARDFAD